MAGSLFSTRETTTRPPASVPLRGRESSGGNAPSDVGMGAPWGSRSGWPRSSARRFVNSSETGDLLRVVFKNRDAHPHTIHFHGFHPAGMDGVFALVAPGQEFVYEFDAEPFGCHLYHCHVMPLKKHIEKGLYGAFVIDPWEGREEADELVMVMNGFDTNFDGANELYAVNTVACHHQRHPVEIKLG